jgi:hypothetical protein
MASERETAFLVLETNLATVSGVITVVRSPFDIDLRRYTQAQLPLVHIKVPPTNPVMLPGERLHNEEELLINLYYVDFSENKTTYESWVEKLIETINTTPTSKVTLDWPAGGMSPVPLEVE